MQVAVSSTPVQILSGSLNIQDALNQRSTCTFTIRDDTGLNHYEEGQAVVITNTDGSIAFGGFLQSVVETKPSPLVATLLSACQCMDYHFLADKRIAAKTYQNMLAGDIVADLISTYLSVEGVAGGAAVLQEKNLTDWANGTLTNLTGYSDTADGSLYITHSGSNQGRTEQSQSDWLAGTLSNIDANTTPGQIQLTQYSAIKITTNLTGSSSNNATTYISIGAAVSQALATGDKLVYDVFCPSTDTSARGAVDNNNNGSTSDLRDLHLLDQYGYDTHPGTDHSYWSQGRWYHRSFDLSSLNGKTVTQWVLAIDGVNFTQAGYAVYFKDIYVLNSSGAVKYIIFDETTGSESFGTPSMINANGAAGTVVQAYVNGQRTSPTLTIANAGIVSSSSISWTTVNVPTGTVVSVQTSIDGQKTWQTATSGAAIPGILPGYKLPSGSTLDVQVLLQPGSLPENGTPSVSSLTVSVISAPLTTKTEYLKTESLQADFSTGSLTNVSSYANYEQMTGDYPWQSWVTGGLDNQTLYTAVSGAQMRAMNGWLQFNYTSAATGASKCKLGNAGTFANFTAEYDIYVPSNAGSSAGCIYRTTSWVSTDGTFAYLANITTSVVQLVRGSNSTNNSETLVSQVSLASSAGQKRHVKIIVNGSNHQVWVDGTQYINATDSTFTAAGQIGLNCYNGTAATNQINFANFGVIPQTGSGGTRVSPGASLTALGTYGSSFVSWNLWLQGGATFTVDVSWDGGTTWQTNVTNGGAIPGMAVGASLSGKTLTWRWNFSTGNVASTPVIYDFTIIVASQYSATGTRTGPTLALDSAISAGSTSVNWDATVPTNSSMSVQTSLDGGTTWSSVSSSGSAIPGINTSQVPWVDPFDVNTLGQYTVTGGGTLSIDLNARMLTASVLSGQSNIYMHPNSLSNTTNIEMDLDFQQLKDGGLYYRSDSGHSNMYRFRQLLSGTFILAKKVSGADTTLGSYVPNLSSGLHRIRLVASGTSHKIYLDGTLIINVTDTQFTSAGEAGMCFIQDSGQSNVSQVILFASYPKGDLTAGKTVETKVTLTTTDPTAFPSLQDITTSVRGQSIESGPLVLSAVFDYVTVANAMDQLATAANFWWNIDYAKTLNFHQTNATPAAVLGTESIMTQASVKVDRGNPSYRNKQYVTNANDQTVQITETKKGDGVAQSWTVGYPIAQQPVVKLNGVVQTLGIKGVSTGMAFYWAAGDPVIAQDAGGTKLQPTDVLEIDYVGSYSLIVITQDQSEVVARAALDGSSGIVEEVMPAPQASTKAQAFQLANSQLAKYAQTANGLSFRTQTPGLQAGQLLACIIPEHNINDELYLIDSVTISNEGTILWYDVHCIQGPVTNSWTQFFQQLSLKGQQYVSAVNIGQGTILALTQEFADAWGWAETVNKTLHTCPIIGPTTLCGPTTIVC